jgi:hypothetical protein
MNQNTFCTNCHRIPSQCCCSSAKESIEDKILAEKDGSFTVNVEGGTVSSPPHILDSGASVMNNEPVAITQADILGILQDAYSVPLGQPIFNSSEEYNKLKAIIESAIRYTHPVKELTDEEIAQEWGKFYPDVFHTHLIDFARAILRKAQEK